MNYYLVTAKCGHVGKGKYHEVEFPICASSKSEAAQSCLKRSKVKKQLKNAITCVVEISRELYLKRIEEMRSDIYVRAHTKREICHYIQMAESLIYENHRKKVNFESRAERVAYIMRKQRMKEVYSHA